MSGPCERHQSWLSRDRGARTFPRLCVVLCESKSFLNCRAELRETVLTASTLADYYGAGNLTCVQVAGLKKPDSLTPEIGLAKGAFPGDPCIFKHIQVSDLRRQLMQ